MYDSIEKHFSKRISCIDLIDHVVVDIQKSSCSFCALRGSSCVDLKSCNAVRSVSEDRLLGLWTDSTGRLVDYPLEVDSVSPVDDEEQ